MEILKIKEADWSNIQNYIMDSDSMDPAERLQISDLISTLKDHIENGGKAFVVDDEDKNLYAGIQFVGDTPFEVPIFRT